MDKVISTFDNKSGYSFEDRYEINESIGSGPFSIVHRCTRRDGQGQSFAVKIIDIKKFNYSPWLTPEDLKREASICQILKHPHIVELIETISSEGFLYMVFEYLEGPDICQEIIRRASSGYVYSESVASHYVRQLLEALKFCHSRNIIHNDLKPESLLLASKENSAPIKLGGFGNARTLDPATGLTSGNPLRLPHFPSPEILREVPYGPKSDIWSCGVVLFLLLGGYLPFFGSKDMIHSQISKGQIKMKPKQWDKVSESAKDLIRQMLAVEPEDRISAEAALKHPWIADKEKFAQKVHLYDSIEEMRKYNMRRKLKGAILNAVSSSKFNSFYGDSTLDGLMKTKIDEEVTMLGAVGQVLESMEEVSCLMDDGIISADIKSSSVVPKKTVRIATTTNSGNEHNNTTSSSPTTDTQPKLSGTAPTSIIKIGSGSGNNSLDLNNEFLHSTLENKKLHSLLDLYDKINSRQIVAPNKTPPSDVVDRTYLVLKALEDDTSLTDDQLGRTLSTELTQILNKPHTRAVFKASDVVAHEIYSTNRSPDLYSSRDCIVPTHTYQTTESRQDDAEVRFKKPPLTSTAHLRPSVSFSTALTPTSSLAGHQAPLANGGVVKFSPSTTSLKNVVVTGVGPGEPGGERNGAVARGGTGGLAPILITRIRLVSFQKSPHEPMGITLKLNEHKKCIVARIMHGGLVYRQGTLQVGDEIKEINGKGVADQSIETLQTLLTQTQGTVSFKIVPSHRNIPPPCEIYVKACFDYDATEDEMIPCPQAGLSFRCGNVLRINSKDDPDWWQATKVDRDVPPLLSPSISSLGLQRISPLSARSNHSDPQDQHLRVSDSSSLNQNDPSSPSARNMSDLNGSGGGSSGTISPNVPTSGHHHLSTPSIYGNIPLPSQQPIKMAGLIPSPELQEWKTACDAIEKTRLDQSPATNCAWFGKRKKSHHYRDKYLVKHNAIFDQLDVVTYEEVVYRDAFKYKTLVLLGAHGVGRRHIKNTLIASHPEGFAYPIPHTTRIPRSDERNGKNYYFISHEEMANDISNNEYLEYGTHNGDMYGTKLSTIKDIYASGKMAILDVEPQALKILRTSQYAPFIVFIAAPALGDFPDQDGSLERLVMESDFLQQTYRHYFDLTVVNNDIDDTISVLEEKVSSLDKTGHWVPVNWVY